MRLAATILLGLVIFVNMEPGTYVGTCDGTPATYEVEDGGNGRGLLAVECQSVALTRTTSGASVTCKERER